MSTIEFHYENDFRLEDSKAYQLWIDRVIRSENFNAGTLNYIFCDDDYLSRIHQKYLKKEDLTDIITFDYVENNTVSGDIFISIERVKENALIYQVEFKNELLRVMSHGLLHLVGYDDISEKDRTLMREKEEEKIKMFHVEQ